MAAKKNKSNVLRIIRLYDAPVRAVWDAWTDPAQVAKWWGPRGFSITTHSKDLRPGGHWAYTMHGPDGVDYPNKTIYFEVEKYARLVYDHGGNGDRPPLFRVTVSFSEIKDQAKTRTKLDMSMTFDTPEAAEEADKFIKKANGYSTWDRLAEFLEKESSGKERFVINRAFDAPLELMFDLWTDPKHFAKWLPPTGAEMEFIRSDIRPGGSAFWRMKAPWGIMHGSARYLEVQRPHRIVYTQQFSDEHEQLSHHPLAPTWPKAMLTVVSLVAESPERTRVTVTWEPYAEATREEIETFVKERGGMTQGWTGSFDKLEALLESGI